MSPFARSSRAVAGERGHPDTGPRVAGATALALPILAVALWLARAGKAGPELPFLLWNLFLALVPWVAGRWVASARSPVVTWLAAGLWLLFLPNAPYLVTDLVHLRHRAPVPIWFDALLFSAFGLAGCVLGWASIETVHHRLVPSVGRRWAAAAIAAVVLLAGFGVYLGRFERWNSWDALLRPGPVLADAVAALASPRAAVFTLLFAAYLGAGYGLFLTRSMWPGAGEGARAVGSGSARGQVKKGADRAPRDVSQAAVDSGDPGA